MVVILQLHRLEAAEGLSLQLVVIAVLPLFLPQINFHFHVIQNQMRIMSLAVHLQFYCCFCAFHFSFLISTQTPFFEMSIIRSQHLHKTFFPVSFKWSQPAFVLGSKFPLPIVNTVSPLTFWNHSRHNKQHQSRINLTLRATFPSWFHFLKGGRQNTPGKPRWMRGYLDSLSKKRWIVLLWKASPFLRR